MANDPKLTLGRLALAELHRRDEERGIDPFGIDRAPEPAAPPPRLVPPLIPPWTDPRDGSSYVTPVREPDPPLHTEDEKALPAKPKAKTPNLDSVREWRTEQMKAAE